MPTSFWRQSLCVMAAVGLLLWHFGDGRLVSGNLLSLRVIHQVVPPAAPFKAPFYLSEITSALGLASPPPPVMRDQDLMAALEGRAMRNGSAGPMAASYALLTTPMDPATAERVLARAPREETDQAVAALWRGRAAWAGGLKTEAVRQWEVAVGDSAAHRKRFAEGLYVASRGPDDVLVAADAAVALMYLSDCHQACRTDTFEMLRYWIGWPALSEEIVVELCNGILDSMRQGQQDQALDGGAANVLARRALALLSLRRVADAEATLDRAEDLQNTVYVRAVRAYFSLRAGRPDTAHTEALAAMHQAGSDGHALMMAAHTLAELGDRAEARRAWTWTIERAPRLAGSAQGFLEDHADDGKN